MKIEENINEIKNILEGIAPIGMIKIGFGQNKVNPESVNPKFENDKIIENIESELKEMDFNDFMLITMAIDGYISESYIDYEYSEEEQKLITKLFDDSDIGDMTEEDSKKIEALKLVSLDSLKKGNHVSEAIIPPKWILKLAETWGEQIMDLWWESVSDLVKAGRVYGTLGDLIEDPNRLKTYYGQLTNVFKKKFAAKYGLEIQPTKERKETIDQTMTKLSSWAGKMLRNGAVIKQNNPEVWQRIQNVLQAKSAKSKVNKKIERNK